MWGVTAQNPPGSPSATKTCASWSGNDDGLRQMRPHSQLHPQPSTPSPEPSTLLAETVSACPSMNQFCCRDSAALWCLQLHPYRLWVATMKVTSKDHGGDMGGHQQDAGGSF